MLLLVLLIIYLTISVKTILRSIPLKPSFTHMIYTSQYGDMNEVDRGDEADTTLFAAGKNIHRERDEVSRTGLTMS